MENNNIKVPEDLEILQIYASRINTLLDKLTEDQVWYIRSLVQSIYDLLSQSLDDFVITKELPTGDDHYKDFLFYCLSLPRERIAALINNPCEELIENRIYYIEFDGENTLENEGYLIYDINSYIQKYILHDESTDMGYDLDANEVINSYQNILKNSIEIPYFLEYKYKC